MKGEMLFLPKFYSMFRINSWYLFLAFYKGRVLSPNTIILPFHFLIPFLHFSSALESNTIDGFRNSRTLLLSKSPQNYLHHCNLILECWRFHVHLLLPKENVNNPASWLELLSLMIREREMVIFDLLTIYFPKFIHSVASYLILLPL